MLNLEVKVNMIFLVVFLILFTLHFIIKKTKSLVLGNIQKTGYIFLILLATLSVNTSGKFVGIHFVLAIIMILISYVFLYREIFQKKMTNNDILNCIWFLVVTVLLFAYIYSNIQNKWDCSFSNVADNKKPFARTVDFIYFSVITFTTTGYGDISPQTSIAKIFVMLENIFAFVLIVVFVIFKNEKNDRSEEENISDKLS